MRFVVLNRRPYSGVRDVMLAHSSFWNLFVSTTISLSKIVLMIFVKSEPGPSYRAALRAWRV